MKKVRKAVIPAAGHGTRFLPVTKALPKEMLALIDTPALQYVAQEAADSGIEEILVVINREKELIRRYFCKEEATCAAERELDDLLERVRFYFVYQDEVIVNDGGEPCLKQLIRAYGRTGKTVLGVQERPRQEAAKYAVIRKGRTEGRLTEVLGIVEKPSPDDMPSTLSSLGRYVLAPDIYGAIERAPVFRGEKYLTHAIDLLTDKGVYAYDFEGVRYDIGDKFGFLQANVEMGLRRYGARMTDYLRGLVEG